MNYVEKLNTVKSALEEISEKAPAIMQTFGPLHQASVKDGVISNKMKELISLGISITIRCDDCISYHMHDAMNAGATEEEILETIHVAVCMGGGPALMYGTHAYEAMKEFKAKAKQ